MLEPTNVVTIESLGSGGSGITHLPDGMIAFVPRTVPGDRVVLGAVRRHKRHAEARIGEIVEPGPGRIEPPCHHFTADRCGGCQWQHVAPQVQSDALRRIVGDALRRIGKFDVPDPELVPSPRQLGYRTTITLTVQWRGAHPVVGFHDAVDPDRVFMLDRCVIARDELHELWTAIRYVLPALPRGDDVRLKLRLAPDGTRHVMVIGGAGAWTSADRVADALKASNLTATIWWQPVDGAPRRVGGAEGDVAAIAFEQVNAEVAAALKAAVLGAASQKDFGRRETGDVPARGAEGVATHSKGTRPVRLPAPGSRVLDLYAGSGDTALPLAEQGLDVVMVEMDKRSVRRAEERARAAGASLRCIAGRVEAHLGNLLPADVVIVNPPRAGISEEVAAKLAAARPARLIYVSCDPATLARDLRRLAVTADQLQLVRAYEMFPQTSHVETLVVADLAPGAGGV